MNDGNKRREDTSNMAGLNEGINSDQMKRYVLGLLPEDEQLQIEQQIQASDACLELFMAMVETVEVEAALTLDETKPLSPDMERLEQRVVSQLLSEQKAMVPIELVQKEKLSQAPKQVAHEKSYRRTTWLQHPATHYTIAASITLLLLGSGTFSSFSQKLAQIDLDANVQKPKPSISVPVDEKSESWSDKIVDQTGSWLDGLQKIRFK